MFKFNAAGWYLRNALVCFHTKLGGCASFCDWLFFQRLSYWVYATAEFSSSDCGYLFDCWWSMWIVLSRSFFFFFDGYNVSLGSHTLAFTRPMCWRNFESLRYTVVLSHCAVGIVDFLCSQFCWFVYHSLAEDNKRKRKCTLLWLAAFKQVAMAAGVQVDRFIQTPDFFVVK